MIECLEEIPPVSIAPTGESYPLPDESAQFEEEARLREFAGRERRTVVVQGIGFVGTAMLAALARVRDEKGSPRYQVIGVDCASESSFWRIAKVQNGEPPVSSSDAELEEAIREGHRLGNLTATSSEIAYALADVVVVDINLDVCKDFANPGASTVDLTIFRSALSAVAAQIRPDALVVIETTVPPGTTENVVAPLFREALERRGLDSSQLAIAHAPERVMPGGRYLESIARFHRVFAGIDERSAERARAFLSSYIDTDRFPLTRLHSPSASETAKVLENAYRAANIAFIQEWTEFAHRAGVDLFEVIDAIRMRPTHANIRQPGLGVGGYCLTKDSLLANWANREFFGAAETLPQSVASIEINDRMPEFTCRLMSEAMPDLGRRSVLLLGISYLNDVADTRCSPSESVYDFCRQQCRSVAAHDPYVAYWPERQLRIARDLGNVDLREIDTLVFLVGHRPFTDMSASEWIALCPAADVVIDANRVLTDSQINDFRQRGLRLIGTGRGSWENPFRHEQA